MHCSSITRKLLDFIKNYMCSDLLRSYLRCCHIEYLLQTLHRSGGNCGKVSLARAQSRRNHVTTWCENDVWYLTPTQLPNRPHSELIFQIRPQQFRIWLHPQFLQHRVMRCYSHCQLCWRKRKQTFMGWLGYGSNGCWMSLVCVPTIYSG